MPQKYRPKSSRERVPPDIMKRAVQKVISANVGLHTAAKQFGINRNTLRRYVRIIKGGGTTDFAENHASTNVFTVQEEENLTEYLETSSRMAHGLTCKMVRRLAYELAVKNSKKIPDSWHKNKEAGYFWLRGFLERNKKLSIRTPEATSLSRATSFNEHNVSLFFNNLRAVLEREHFGPESLWNTDETGVCTVQKCPKVVAPKQLKQVGQVTSAERGTLVTLCNSINALGNSIPPFYVFPRKKTNPAFLFGGPPGSQAAAHSSGWMTEEVFLLYLKHFVKYVKCSIENKVLLLLDNYESHVSLGIIEFARDNGIIMLTFPPHCSHRLQPLDVSVYGPFKQFFNQAVSKRITIEKPGIPVTIYEIAALTNTAFTSAFTPANIISGFRASGVWPFNDQIFSEADFLPSFVTDRPPPEEENSATASLTSNTKNVLPDSHPVLDVAPETCHNSIPSTSSIAPSAVWSSLTTLGLPASPSPFPVISPEQIHPFPKAGERKNKNKGRKKGKSTVLTDTPHKMEIEEAHHIKAEKKKKQEERAAARLKKKLFGSPKKGRKAGPQRKKSKLLTDCSSESDLEVPSSESDSGSEDENPNLPAPDDWVIVKFLGKKSIKRFVGQVIESSPDGIMLVKFARRVEFNRFKWPEIDDISEVDPHQIEQILNKPKIVYQNDRVTSIVFSDVFNFIVE